MSHIEKIILASHGVFADGLLTAAELIIGKNPAVKAFSLDRYNSPMQIRELVLQELKDDAVERAILLCDIKGGSVHNHLLDLCTRPGVYLITGMNLAMTLNLIATLGEESICARIAESMEIGKSDIQCFDSDFVKKTLETAVEDEL